ncbi:hypothetical protein QJQ45_017054 [Haematococcus lacustris]|nr:hypothetical protein QJQ45_017054 [Haematococcus lacustris]
MQATMLSPSIEAEVNARCVILTLNQHQCEQLTIIATYWPSGSNGEALSLREKMQEHIRTATGHLPGSLILAGDINATMKTEDRSEHTEYTQDSMMRGFATEMHLLEADPGDRAWTYQQPHCNSRIDAILTRDARHGPEHRTHVHTNAYLSDHRPLTATLNTARLGIDLAAPHKPPKHSHTILTTPITNKDREAYRLAVQQPCSGVPQLHAELTAFLAPIYTEATHHLATLGRTNPQQPQRLTSVAGRPAREAVDTAATMLTNLLQTCRTAAIKTCNTKTLTRGGQHYQRRTMCRIRLALGRKLKTARDLGRKANSLFKQTNVHPTIDELIPETDATNEEIRDAVQARQGEDPTENRVQAAVQYPKKANKRILRPSRTDHKGLQALADPDTKTICTAPADLNRIITTAYGQKLSAPTPKTGHYTNTQTRNYPWARAKADDAFSMHACQNIHWLHTAIMDKAGFEECISRLAGGKAPGPDGVENEIIKMLPWEMRETIHQLFIIMWATGCTPTTWKTSDTCLLYKDKGQETDLNSYRPVGLANTVYKLWTSLITKTLSEYAEANGMLSKNQAGFRSHRNTTQQLQMLVMALEDAKLAKADIYALLVDFTSAFNTTCQDKLLWIMHDLGFPTDATDAVKDLYTGATTRFKTPYGHTDPVSVNRGTIQGDSLSPFLFLIYIEPLLRWLQVGARGYKFKSATADSGERATVSSIDYADDIAILCNTLRNLRCQADKLSAFSDWGHLIISHSKTLATAALHHSVETGMCSNAAEADKRARQQLQTVSLQGKPVTYHRPTSPFTYLGVLITMTLDWKPQHTAMITQLRQKLERLRSSFASARQAIHIIRTAIIPSLAYSFCAVPCTPGDLELYDRSINQCVKLKLRLPLGTPNAIIREDAEKLGMGISSTAQEYHARNTTALIHSLQSTDVAHAHISRSMLHKQITWLSTQASTHGHRMLTLLHHTLRARQLVYASISGLTATEEGLPLYHEECQTLGRLITQASSSQAHDVVSASITCLKSLGITHASELSCKGNTHIITGSMLTSKYGKKVKQKHIIALNKLAAMAAQPSCPDVTATRAIRDSRNTSLDLPPDQRKITTWAAGLTELAPTPAVPDTKTRYMDMKAYAAMHATQPATADRAAAAPAAHDATRTSSRLLKREQRATQSAQTKPTPPKAGTKRNNEGRQTQTIPQDIVRIVGLDLPGLSSWKVDKACRCKPKNLGCILGAMYGHQEAITSIDGWQWDGINKENYYKVHWKPTVIDSFSALAGAQGAVRCRCPFQFGAAQAGICGAQMTALQSGIQTAISEDWLHHACASGATRLEDSPLKPLESISPNPLFCWPSSQTRCDLRSYAQMQGCGVSMGAFLEALNAAHHPLALYPPQQIRTDSFSQAFFDYLRAIDRLLSMPSLLQQRSDLQAQLFRGAFSDCPICALVPGVPQDGYEHCVAGDACNKPSSYAGVAKATRDLEQHTDTYLDRTGLEGAVQQLHDSGQISLSGAFAAARATTEATGAGADAAVVSARLAGVDSEAHDCSTLLSYFRSETSNITAGQPCAVRGVVGFVCCHDVQLLALYCNMRTAEQFVYYLLAWHAACDMLHLYIDLACQFQVGCAPWRSTMAVPYPGGAAHHSVHELGLQRDRMGQSDKDTRAASNAIKAKLRTARQLLKEAALYQALGSGEDAAARMQQLSA